MAYEKQTWATGNTITAEKLNHMEDGIADSKMKNVYDVNSYEHQELATIYKDENDYIYSIENGENVYWTYEKLVEIINAVSVYDDDEEGCIPTQTIYFTNPGEEDTLLTCWNSIDEEYTYLDIYTFGSQTELRIDWDGQAEKAKENTATSITYPLTFGVLVPSSDGDLNAVIENSLTNYVSGKCSRASGWSTKATGKYANAEGYESIASGDNSHAEGNSIASGPFSHAEGRSKALEGNAHSEGSSTLASGFSSHAEGGGTIANHAYQHVFGQYNVEDPSSAISTQRGTYVEIVGNGILSSSRRNARTLDWNGNERLNGSLTLGTGTADETTITASQLKALLALLN